MILLSLHCFTVILSCGKKENILLNQILKLSSILHLLFSLLCYIDYSFQVHFSKYVLVIGTWFCLLFIGLLAYFYLEEINSLTFSVYF